MVYFLTKERKLLAISEEHASAFYKTFIEQEREVRWEVSDAKCTLFIGLAERSVWACAVTDSSTAAACTTSLTCKPLANHLSVSVRIT